MATTDECLVCGRPVDTSGRPNATARPVHQACYELRSGGARFARQMEHESLDDYHRAQRRYPDQKVRPVAR